MIASSAQMIGGQGSIDSGGEPGSAAEDEVLGVLVLGDVLSLPGRRRECRHGDIAFNAVTSGSCTTVIHLHSCPQAVGNFAERNTGCTIVSAGSKGSDDRTSGRGHRASSRCARAAVAAVSTASTATAARAAAPGQRRGLAGSAAEGAWRPSGPGYHARRPAHRPRRRAVAGGPGPARGGRPSPVARGPGGVPPACMPPRRGLRPAGAGINCLDDGS
jgi:hypothetical protein